MLYLIDAEVRGSNYTEDNYCYLNDFDEFMKLEFYAPKEYRSIRVYDASVRDFLHKNYGKIAGIKSFSDDDAVLQIFDEKELQ